TRTSGLFKKLLSENGGELSRFVEARDDVAAADELPADVELREGRPVGVLLEARPQILIAEGVHVAVPDALLLQNPDHFGGEAALREVLRALHEEHDFGAFDGVFDAVAQRVVHLYLD